MIQINNVDYLPCAPVSPASSSFIFLRTMAERAGRYNFSHPFPSLASNWSKLVRWRTESSFSPWPPKHTASVFKTTSYPPSGTMKP